MRRRRSYAKGIWQQAELFAAQERAAQPAVVPEAPRSKPLANPSPKPSPAKTSFKLPVLQQRESLWLSIRFMNLSLNAVAAVNAYQPAVVTAVMNQGVRVLSCNRSACNAGIEPGMPVNAALALLPELAFFERDERLESELLTELAERAQAFTSVVSLSGEDTLLLELRGSLLLFGGLEALVESVRGEFEAYEFVLASSPVAQAAEWLTQAGCELHLSSKDAPELKALPVRALGWPEHLLSQLTRIGAESIGDCLRLPRDGFAKRFGVERLQELDRGLGVFPDVRTARSFIESFNNLLELPYESADTTLLLTGIEQQIFRLQKFLRRRQLAVCHLDISLNCRDKSVRDVHMELLEPYFDAALLMELIALRFERLTLQSPVLSIEVAAEQFVSLQAGTEELPVALDAAVMPANDMALKEALSPAGLRLVERLRTRLGYQYVYGVSVVDDHRPERAWQLSDPASATGRDDGGSLVERPLWLLHEPRRIAQVAAESKPERIESGWWDGDDVSRDYYSMTRESGQRCWVYRDKAGWYLHGLFG